MITSSNAKPSARRSPFQTLSKEEAERASSLPHHKKKKSSSQSFFLSCLTGGKGSKDAQRKQ